MNSLDLFLLFHIFLLVATSSFARQSLLIDKIMIIYQKKHKPLKRVRTFITNSATVSFWCFGFKGEFQQEQVYTEYNLGLFYTKEYDTLDTIVQVACDLSV